MEDLPRPKDPMSFSGHRAESWMGWPVPAQLPRLLFPLKIPWNGPDHAYSFQQPSEEPIRPVLCSGIKTKSLVHFPSSHC